MILPNKLVDIQSSLIYEALELFYSSDEILIATKYSDIELLTILFALGYIDAEGRKQCSSI